MIRTSRRGFLAGATTLAALPGFARAERSDILATDFMTPPNSAKPRVWWHWMNGNVTKDGIAKDFAWMKRVGIGGVQNFDAALNTPQVVQNRLVYMSPEWKDAFRYAVRRADQLDLEFAIAASPGWSETGGPWVEPKDGMKKLVWSETIVEGGERHQLAPPPTATGPFQDMSASGGINISAEQAGALPTHYADVAVLAYPTGSGEVLPPPAITVAGANIDAALVSGGDAAGIPLPRGAGGAPGYVQLDYMQQQTVRAARVFVKDLPGFSVLGTTTGQLQASNDGRTWRTIVELELKNIPTTLSFAPVTARHFRLALMTAGGAMDPSSSFFTMAPGVDLSSLMATFAQPGVTIPSPKLTLFQLFSDARVNHFEKKAGYVLADDYFALDQGVGPDVAGIPPAAVIDVTEHMSPDGALNWTPPPGRWKVLRLGYSLTGKTNHPATAEATGLEVDKFDAVAVEAYLNHYLDMYRDAAGADMMGAHGLRALLTDSTEVGPANWTPHMLEHFQRLRGYDATAWLPVLTGEIIGSRTQSDAFLFDFRHTLAELHSTQHYGTVAKVAHERGLIVYGESLEGERVALGDDLDMRSFADIPMAALWSFRDHPRPGYIADDRGAASVAHLRGSTLVACESLTSIGQPWTYAPRDLQPMIDQIFANGVNRAVIHTSVHQPLDRGPGLSLAVFGQYFTRLESWAEMAKPWVDYIARNCYLLQQGRNVADVAYFYGEDTPVAVQAKDRYLPDVPRAYAYDFVSANALDLLSVDNGDLVSRGGARYKVLYLNAKSAHMTLTTLRKIAAFAEAGGTIVGEAPQSSPSLMDDAGEFTQLTRRLWAGPGTTEVGRGRVIAGRDLEAALAHVGCAPDFAHASDAEIQFVHRRFDGGDLYFVTNRTEAQVQGEARFRVTGKAAELWRADSGLAELISYRFDGQHTVVPLDLRAYESVFVVFRTATSAAAANVPRPSYQQVGAVDGPWNVAFQPGRGAPASVTLASLGSLSEQTESGVKYFSGVATYTKTFDLPADARRGAPLLVDLGAIGDIAEVRVNGRYAGTAWKAPYRVDIGPYVRAGRNSIDIRVANLWVNRLIGDQQQGAEKIGFTAVPTFTRTAPLRPSGLIGPVTLWTTTAG